MITDIKDFITVTLAKRLASPIISTFIFCWCIANYNIFLVAFSSSDWAIKLSYIQQTVSIDYSSLYNIFRSTLNTSFPLLLSFFYVFVWPMVDIHIFTFSKKQNFKYRARQIQLDNDSPVSEGELRKFRKRWDNKFKEYNDDISEKNDLILDLENKIVKLHSTINEYDKEIKGYQDRLTEDEIAKKKDSEESYHNYLAEQADEQEKERNENYEIISNLTPEQKSQIYAPHSHSSSQEKSSDAIESTVKKDNAVDIGATDSASKDKTIHSTCKITEGIMKEYYLKGRSIDKSKKINFNLFELPTKIQSLLVELYYSSDLNELNIPVLLTISDQPYVKDASIWELDIEPDSFSSDEDLVELWATDLLSILETRNESILTFSFKVQAYLRKNY